MSENTVQIQEVTYGPPGEAQVSNVIVTKSSNSFIVTSQPLNKNKLPLDIDKEEIQQTSSI